MTGMTTRVDAGVGRGEPQLRQPRLLRHQRGPRQGDALRRQRRRGAGAPAWLRDVLGPALGKALRARGGIDLKPLIARGLAHGRRDAPAQRRLLERCSCARSAPSLARTSDDRRGARRRASPSSRRTTSSSSTSRWRWARRMTDPAQRHRGSTVVTAMSRNGTDFGIRVSGLGDRWFTAPSRCRTGSTFPAIRARTPTPTWATPRSWRPSGSAALRWRRRPRSSDSSARARRRRQAISRARWARSRSARIREWTIPALDFAGVPTGIDVRLVVETGTRARPSTPASRIASPASARSAPAWCGRRWPASSRRSRPLPRDLGVS